LSRRLSLGGALFGALLAASLIAAVLVVRARDPDLALEVTQRVCDPEPCVGRTKETFAFDPGRQSAMITFFVREDDPDGFVAIVGEDGEAVRTLDSGVSLSESEEVTYRWDGRDDAGSIVAPRSYYLRVDLPATDRDMTWPRRIRVVRTPDSEAEQPAE
jgi:flagellar hook capping protein FlgD